MLQRTIEKRLSALEKRVSELDHQVNQSSPVKDWRRSIGAFTDDPAMQALMDDAVRLRAADRTVAKRRGKKSSRA